VPYNTLKPRALEEYAEEIVSASGYTTRISVNSVVSVIVFNNERAIIDGTTDETYALELYRKVVLSKEVLDF